MTREGTRELNIGEAVKLNGKVVLYMEPRRYLGLDRTGRLAIIESREEVEPLKYEHLTIFLRNRLLFLNQKYGDYEEEL